MGSSLSGDKSRRNEAQNVSTSLTGKSDQISGLNEQQGQQQQNHLDDLTRVPKISQNDQSSDMPNVAADSGLINATASIQTTTPRGNTDDFSINLFGYILYPPRWITMTIPPWLGSLSSLAMIICCVLPYVPQYITIYKTRSCVGFSTFVCLTLLLANILRIAFWFGDHFELPLLIQSIVMILTQLLLLELCVRVKRQNAGFLVKKTLFSFKPRLFWRWTHFSSYLEFLFIITALLSVTVYFLVDCKPFIKALGYCALVTESLLGLPQVIENLKNRSVKGMNLSMVVMWLAGDLYKTAYFIINETPYQFWLCGMLQISIDLIVLCQVCLYRQNAPMKKQSISKARPDSPKVLMSL